MRTIKLIRHFLFLFSNDIIKMTTCINYNDLSQSCDSGTQIEIKKLANTLFKFSGTKTSGMRTSELKMTTALCEDPLSLEIAYHVDNSKYNDIEKSLINLKSCFKKNQILFEAEKDAVTLTRAISNPSNMNVSKVSNFIYIKNDQFSKRTDNVTAVCFALARSRKYSDNKLCL